MVLLGGGGVVVFVLISVILIVVGIIFRYSLVIIMLAIRLYRIDGCDTSNAHQ